MRKLMLATASILVLAGSGAVLAQDATTAPAVPPATTVTPDMPGHAADMYRSYSRMEPGSFAGTIAGGFTAEQLIGRDVVDMDGNNIGEVRDLLIDRNDQVSSVLVDVGGFLGIGTRTVALDLASMRAEQGDDNLVVPYTKEQLEALPAYEEADNGWRRAD
jgi:sporulation protein YlmC with PRC-barrel domain